jgi:hypothetical protein
MSTRRVQPQPRCARMPLNGAACLSLAHAQACSKLCANSCWLRGRRQRKRTCTYTPHRQAKVLAARRFWTWKTLWKQKTRGWKQKSRAWKKVDKVATTSQCHRFLVLPDVARHYVNGRLRACIFGFSPAVRVHAGCHRRCQFSWPDSPVSRIKSDCER